MKVRNGFEGTGRFYINLLFEEKNMTKYNLKGIDIVVYDNGKFVIDNDGFFEN